MKKHRGYYALYKSGDLVYTLDPPWTGVVMFEDRELPPNEIKALWRPDPEDRAHAWKLLAEAWALGARQDRIQFLVKKWLIGGVPRDAELFAGQTHLAVHTLKCGDDPFLRPLPLFAVTFETAESAVEEPAGIGTTELEAFARFVKKCLKEGVDPWHGGSPPSVGG